MSLKPRHNKSPEDWMERDAKKQMEEQMKKMMKKKKRPHEDPRFAGMKVNAVRQQQRRQHIVSSVVARANQKKLFGMPLLPEEQWVMSNQDILA